MIRVAISGVAGRIGSLMANLALDDKKCRVVGALEAPGHAALGQDLGQFLGRPTTQVVITEDAASALADADVLIEFTSPEATLQHARAAATHRVTMVIGTTGLNAAQEGELRRLSRRTAILHSPNMSLGVLIVRRMLAEAARVMTACGLDRGVAFQIVETHHVHKKDRPSGTAKLLATEIARVFPKQARPVPIESRREGEVVGIHEILLAFGDERIRLEHDAQSRRIFAQGALVVAKFLVERLGRKPGFYDMDAFAQHLLAAMIHRRRSR